QYLISERLFDLFVNEPGHRSGAVSCIKAILCKPLTGLVRQFNDHAFFGKLAIQLADKFVDDEFDHLDVESFEGHPCVQTVAKLRCEGTLDHPFRVSLCVGCVSEAEA